MLNKINRLHFFAFVPSIESSFCLDTLYGISSDGFDNLEADGEDGHEEGEGAGRGEYPRRERDAVAEVSEPVVHDIP